MRYELNILRINPFMRANREFEIIHMVDKRVKSDQVIRGWCRIEPNKLFNDRLNYTIRGIC